MNLRSEDDRSLDASHDGDLYGFLADFCFFRSGQIDVIAEEVFWKNSLSKRAMHPQKKCGPDRMAKLQFLRMRKKRSTQAIQDTEAQRDVIRDDREARARFIERRNHSSGDDLFHLITNSSYYS